MKKTIIPFLLAGMLTAFAVIHTNEKAIKETDSYSTIQAKSKPMQKKKSQACPFKKYKKTKPSTEKSASFCSPQPISKLAVPFCKKNYLNRYQIEYISTQDPAQIEDKSALSSIYA